MIGRTTPERASGRACLFCRIARKEIPAGIIWETAELLAFRDISPQAPAHILIIPKAHVSTLSEATDAEAVGRLVLAAADVARQEGFADAGYRVVINTHVDGGQTVGHLHLHVLAGRRMLWPPG